jgi:hypothetical protein
MDTNNEANSPFSCLFLHLVSKYSPQLHPPKRIQFIWFSSGSKSVNFRVLTIDAVCTETTRGQWEMVNACGAVGGRRNAASTQCIHTRQLRINLRLKCRSGSAVPISVFSCALGRRRDEVTGGWRKLHNEELHSMCSSIKIIGMVELRKMKMASYVARMSEKTCKILLRDNCRGD